MRQHIAFLAFLVLLAVPAVAQEQYRVFFAFDSSRLDAQAEQVIDRAVSTYRQTGSTSISAVGHTDTVGSDAYNQALSERRARSVAEALVARGVPRDEIVIAGRGQRELAVQTADGVREPQNRRVVITTGQPQQPVAAAPAPPPEPEPEEDRLSFLVAPYYGMRIHPDDASGWLGHNIGANLIVNYDAFDQIGIEGEQAFFYSTDGETWGGRSAIGLNYVGLSNVITVGALGGEIFPYFGANFGGTYGGDGFNDGLFAGPEIGMRIGPVEMKVAYDIPFDDGWDEGIVSFTLGAGFRF